MRHAAQPRPGDYFETLRLFNRNTRFFLLTYILVLFGIFGMHAVLFNLYLLRLDYGTEFIGLINGIGLFSIAVFAVPAGWIGKMKGNRKALIGGLAVSAVSLAFIPANELMRPTAARACLLLCFGLLGLGNALFFVNAGPYLMSAAGARERNHVFSLQAAGGALAAFAGSLLAGLLPGLFGSLLGRPLGHPAPYRYALLLPPLFYGLALACCLKTRPVQVPGSQSREGKGRIPVLLIAAFAAVLFLRMAGEQAARVFFNIYMYSRLAVPTALIGALAASAQLVAIPVALVLPYLTQRWGRYRLLVGGLLVTCGSLLVMTVPHWVAAGCALIGVMAIHSILGPTSLMYQQELVAPRWREIMTGSTHMAMGLSSSAMALSGGYLIGARGYASVFVIGAACVAVSALFFAMFFRRPRGEPARLSRSRQ